MAKKNKKKKEIIQSFTNNKMNLFIQILVCLIIALVIYGVLALITDYRNNNNIKTSVNNEAIFSMSDLMIRNSIYGDIESVVITEFGNPTKIEKFKDGKISYKKYKYSGLELTFRDYDGTYKLMKAVVTSDDYLMTRDIRVGDSINEVINKFAITKTSGDYLYGNYRENAFTSKSVKDDSIYYGKKSDDIVYYIYATTPYDKGYATWEDDIAQLTFKVSFGKVKRIEWMYGPVVQE